MEKIVDFEISTQARRASFTTNCLALASTKDGVQIADQIDEDGNQQWSQSSILTRCAVHVNTAVINDVSQRYVRSLEIRQCDHVGGLHYLLDGVIENTDTPKRWKTFGSLPLVTGSSQHKWQKESLRQDLNRESVRNAIAIRLL